MRIHSLSMERAATPMLKQLRTWLWTLSVVILAGSVGCRDTASPAPTAGSSGQKPALAEDAEVLKRLEAAGAPLVLNEQGLVTQIAFREPARLTDELAEQLAQLRNLQTLAVGQSGLSLAGWETLGKIPSLRQLDLRDCELGNDEFQALVSNLNNLVSVRLSGKTGATTVDDSGLAALRDKPQLKVLALDYLWVSDTGLAELESSRELRELYLAGSLVDDAALERLSNMPSLRKLRLARTSVGKDGLAHLAKLPLEELDLSECSLVDNAALEPIGKIVSMKKLNLWRDAVGDEGVAQLAELKQLEWLNLDNTQITDGSLPVVAGFTKLTFLHLGSTAVSNAGIGQLAPLKSLKDLKVTRTSVTEEGVAELRQAIPGVDIQLKYREDEAAP
jgi:hypothetical protein